MKSLVLAVIIALLAPAIAPSAVINVTAGDGAGVIFAVSTPTATGGTPTVTPTPPLPPHLPAADAAKAAAACQAGLDNAVLTYLGKALTNLDKCTVPLARCVETKPGIQGCLDKSAKTCTKELGKRATAAQKLQDDVRKRCGKSSFADLRDGAGLDFDQLGAPCAGAVDLAGLAQCLALQQRCAAEDAFELAVPRVRQLLPLASVDLSALPCLDALGGDGNLADAAAAKHLGTCLKSTAKNGRGYLLKALKALAKCADEVQTCVQTKPGDDKCLPKAASSCAKQLHAIDDQAAKLADALDADCHALDPASLLLADGANVVGLTASCAAVDVAPLASLTDYASCMTRQSRCIVERVLRSTAPRLTELLTLGGAAPSAFCGS